MKIIQNILWKIQKGATVGDLTKRERKALRQHASATRDQVLNLMLGDPTMVRYRSEKIVADAEGEFPYLAHVEKPYVGMADIGDEPDVNYANDGV